MPTSDQVRMARALLRLTMKELSKLSEIDPSTIVRVEAGAKTYAMTLRQLQASFEAAGVVFIDPVEGVHQGAVGLKWGAEIPLREPKAEGRTGPYSQGASQAAPWDEGIDALHEEAAQSADPEIEAMRAYWREHPSEWAGLSPAGQRVLLQEMRLDSLSAGVI